jgi:hypothetical protein
MQDIKTRDRLRSFLTPCLDQSCVWHLSRHPCRTFDRVDVNELFGRTASTLMYVQIIHLCIPEGSLIEGKTLFFQVSRKASQRNVVH